MQFPKHDEKRLPRLLLCVGMATTAEETGVEMAAQNGAFVCEIRELFESFSAGGGGGGGRE